MQKTGIKLVAFLVLILVSFAQKKAGAAIVVAGKKDMNTNAAAKRKDTIAYINKGAHGETSNCKNPNGCDFITVNYPDFKDNESLNNAIKRKIIDYLSPYCDRKLDLKNFDKSLKKIAQSYNNKSDTSTVDQLPATYELNVDVIVQDSSLIMLDFSQDDSGGAHPNHNDEYLNWNIRADKTISLDDLLINDYETQLTHIAETIFRKDENLSKDQSLADYNFENNTFALNNNFQITPDGINFFYNSYEIKSYAEGTTDLLIPYTAIKKLLRPNTVINQYNK